MKPALLLMCAVTCGLSHALAADTTEKVCVKSPEAIWGCFWTKGVLTQSADAGIVVTVQETGSYILDSVPDGIFSLLLPKRDSDGSVRYVAGDYLFCPFSPRMHRSADPQVFEWRDYGCVEEFRNATAVPSSDKQWSVRICRLVDCTRPGFSEFAHDASQGR